MSRDIIAFTGPIASGKDTAARYVSESLEIPVFRISDALKEIAQRKRIELTRKNLEMLGTKVAEQLGDEYLAQYILNKNHQHFIVTDIWQMGQIAVLGSYNLTLISMDADPATRFARMKQNAKLGEATTYDEFMLNEQRENSPPNPQRVFECMRLADSHIINNGSLDVLHGALCDTLLASER